MKRILVGVFSLILMIAWFVLTFSDLQENWVETIRGACLKSGLVLGAIWLAYPQVTVILRRVPPWMIGCMGIGLLVVIRWPKAAVVVVPTLLILWLLRPRTTQQSAGPKRPRTPKQRTRPAQAPSPRSSTREAPSSQPAPPDSAASNSQHSR